MNEFRVIINDDQKKVKVPAGMRMLIRRSFNATLISENFKKEAVLYITFVDNNKIQELNKKYREIDKPTDVLSFPFGSKKELDIDPKTKKVLLGDVYISLERAAEQAKEYGNVFQREVIYLTVHSILHLLGYEHKNGGLEKVRMREKEEGVMAKLGFERTFSYAI